MRIVHYLRRVWEEDGGVPRAALDMATWQARAGAEVVLATTDPRDVPRSWEGAGKPRVRVMGKPRGPAWMDGAFRREAEGLVAGADVLHLHGMWDLLQVPLARACERAGRGYVISPHGMLGDWSVRQRWLKKRAYTAVFGRRLVEGARAMVLAARGELEESASKHARTPGVVLPLVFDTDPFVVEPGPELARERLGLPDASMPTVLFLSRLHYVKRPDLLLAAAQRLMRTGLEFRVVIAGAGDEGYVSKLKRFASSMGVLEKCVFVGAVYEPGLKASLYRACDVFCLASSHENFGFVFLESLASGTPVVTTKASAIWPELQASGAGHIVERIEGDGQADAPEAGRVEELAGVLGELLTKRQSLRSQGEAGRAWVLREMHPKVVTERYLEMYRGVMKGEVSAGHGRADGPRAGGMPKMPG